MDFVECGSFCDSILDCSKEALRFPQAAFTDVEYLQDNVITHSTSLEAYDSIISRGEAIGAVSDDIRYDGFSNDTEPFRSVYFMANASSDGVIFPWSVYPKSLKDGTAIKILSIDAGLLLDNTYKLFYVGSTPTQFGQKFLRTYQSHVLAIRADDRKHLNLATVQYSHVDLNNDNLLSFEGRQARIATRVLVEGQSYPNKVMISFCNSLKVGSANVRTLDATKVAWHNAKIGCPFDSCSYRSDSWEYLKDHYRAVHLKLSICQCHLCDRIFSWPGYLKWHITFVHENTRPHQCSLCDKKFSSKGGLRIHIAHIHDKQRAHMCSQCGKSFTQRGALTHHIDSVHNKRRPHECRHCGKCFSRKCTMNNHVAKFHDET